MDPMGCLQSTFSILFSGLHWTRISLIFRPIISGQITIIHDGEVYVDMYYRVPMELMVTWVTN